MRSRLVCRRDGLPCLQLNITSASTPARSLNSNSAHTSLPCFLLPQRYARENNAEFAARLYDEYRTRGGEPQLWMTNLLVRRHCGGRQGGQRCCCLGQSPFSPSQLGTYARRHEGDRAWELYQRLLAAGELAPNL